MTTATDIHDRLLKEDVRFQRLFEEHRRYEQRLEQLQSRRWLSDEERVEEVQLKKRKLALKDEMAAIVRCAGE